MGIFKRRLKRMHCPQCLGWMYPVPKSKQDEIERFLDRTFSERTGSRHKHVRVKCESCGFDFMARPDVDFDDQS